MKKKILIIGGNSSIARAYCKMFGSHYSIISTSSKKLKKSKLIHLDLESENSIIKFLNILGAKKFDRILVCSGIINGKNIKDTSFNEIQKVFQINAIGIMKIFTKIISNNTKKGTKIIFVTSISERKGSYDEVYAGSKGALSKFAKSIANNYGKKIRVNTIAPSVIEGTRMEKMMSRENINKIKNMTPNKKILKINDVGKIIEDLFSDHWDHTNGSVIDINGGLY